ncbi:MAG: type II toxin-antitoxin system HicA family toxin [Armatimonadetes bacterium]|nr:type II toxin-antitoxin system HicA family toxin [Armatimonadota bacterium]MCX7968276.1 type II toxin-antitoxin system HicA family toxin [Armatimonadota bacterium]MDW8142097.1 type II toxin-antitoxin system HicA family toxin [Armatimonadota bacterium]
MRLPRDLGGEELAKQLSKYGYQIVRQMGSHMRLVSMLKNKPHRITVPRHKPLRVGTLDGILREVAKYLEMDKRDLIRDLWGD